MQKINHPNVNVDAEAVPTSAAAKAVEPTWMEGAEFEQANLRQQAEDAVWAMFGGDAKRVVLLNDNPELAKQTGLAARNLPDWTLVGVWERTSVSDEMREFLHARQVGLPISTVNGSEIVLGRVMVNRVTTEIVAAVIAININGTTVPEVYRLVDGVWKYMPETHVSRARVYAWAKEHGVKHVPLTYWHIVAAVMAGKTLRTIGDDGTERIIGRFMAEAVEAYIAAGQAV